MHTRKALPVFFIILALAAACAATTGVGKVKEALLYDRTVAIAGAKQIEALHKAGTVDTAMYEQAKMAYSIWQAAHNSAVDAVGVAQVAQKGGQPWDQARLADLQSAASRLFASLLTIYQAVGALK